MSQLAAEIMPLYALMYMKLVFNGFSIALGDKFLNFLTISRNHIFSTTKKLNICTNLMNAFPVTFVFDEPAADS